jgi:hypothetical protein
MWSNRLERGITMGQLSGVSRDSLAADESADPGHTYSGRAMGASAVCMTLPLSEHESGLQHIFSRAVAAIFLLSRSYLVDSGRDRKL